MQSLSHQAIILVLEEEEEESLCLYRVLFAFRHLIQYEKL